MATDFCAIFQSKDLKVLFLLEACFDLISGSSLSMKIQITKNLGFNFFSFSFHFQTFHTNAVFYGEFENEKKKKGQKF